MHLRLLRWAVAPAGLALFLLAGQTSFTRAQTTTGNDRHDRDVDGCGDQRGLRKVPRPPGRQERRLHSGARQSESQSVRHCHVGADGKVHTAGDVDVARSRSSRSRKYSRWRASFRIRAPMPSRNASAWTPPACGSTRSSPSRWRTSCRRAGNERARQPRRDHRDQHGAGKHGATRSGEDHRHPQRLRRPRPVGDAGCLQVRGRHQPAQPGDRHADVRLRLHQGQPAAATDLYTRQCSIGVNAKDLATMAATLAVRRKNPVTGKQAIDAKNVPYVLAVMATAGSVRRLGQMALPHGPAGQERRRRRDHRGLARQVRYRRRLAAA